MESIGIGITTRNRPDVIEFCVKQHLKHFNRNAKYLVVDDNSDDPDQNRKWAETIGEYHYNEKRLGIAKSKNLCIKSLDVDHLFLFDDDCFPIRNDWWIPWIDGSVNFMVFACEETISVKAARLILVQVLPIC